MSPFRQARAVKGVLHRCLVFHDWFATTTQLNEATEFTQALRVHFDFACRAWENTLPRSEFRPDARGRYRIHEGLICEKCREAGKLDGRGRKRNHIDK